MPSLTHYAFSTRTARLIVGYILLIPRLVKYVTTFSPWMDMGTEQVIRTTIELK